MTKLEYIVVIVTLLLLFGILFIPLIKDKECKAKYGQQSYLYRGDRGFGICVLENGDLKGL